MAKLAIEYIPTTALIPFTQNARTHSKQQINQIVNSIKAFGFNNPVLIDGDLGIIAGHGRVIAAEKMKLAKVPTVQLEHLTEAEKRAYILADNKIALNAGWDEHILAAEFGELNGLDLELTGFSESELAAILEDDSLIFSPGEKGDQGPLDELEPDVVTCPHCHESFDRRLND